MSKIKETLKKMPWFAILTAAAFIAVQSIFYYLARLIIDSTGGITSRGSIPWISFDDKIPFLPGFIYIYVGSYVIWIIGAILVCLTKKENYINFIFVTFISMFIGFIILCAWPTYLDRAKDVYVSKFINDIDNKKGLTWWLVRFIYKSDGISAAYPEFPSFHCLDTVCLYLAIHNQKEIKKWWRISFLILTILVCLSTVFVKQHYILDVISGILIPVAVYAIIYLIKLRNVVSKRT